MATLKRSYLTLIILSLLQEKPMYGYQLCQVVKERSGGNIEIKYGALYPLLHSLEDSGVITGKWRASAHGPERKYFELTPRGQKMLGQEKNALKSIHALVITTGEQGV